MKLQLKYNIKEDTFDVLSEFKQEKIAEVIGECIRAQMGAGTDNSEPNTKNIYTILIDLDLTDDTFHISSDTGNKSLSCGIIAHFLQQISSAKVKGRYELALERWNDN